MRAALIAMLLLPTVCKGQCYTAPAQFEVAEIKQSKAAGPVTGAILPSGSITVRSVTLKSLISGAWETREFAVLGGPDWVATDRFDLIAKAPPQSPPEAIHAMMRALLTEQFQLAVHQEEKTMRVYALITTHGGAKLQPAKSNPEWTGCRGQRENGEARRTCYSVTMNIFAQILASVSPHYIDLPVVNHTELPGAYDFSFSWTPQQLLDLPNNGVRSANVSRMAIFEALPRELGLKLESRKEAHAAIVIDRIARIQSEN